MLLDYIIENFDNGEPIFLDELPYKSKDSLRQEMKKLTDSGEIIRLYNGVYYKPFKTILGTEGKMAINKFIEKRFIFKSNEKYGYVKGIGLYNKYGFTTQIPSVIEVASNMATTKQRRINVDGYNIIVYKPVVEINNDNVNEIEFLDLVTDIDVYSEIVGDELKGKLREFIDKKKIDFLKVKKLLINFPDKTYRNLYLGGIMNELV